MPLPVPGEGAGDDGRLDADGDRRRHGLRGTGRAAPADGGGAARARVGRARGANGLPRRARGCVLPSQERRAVAGHDPGARGELPAQDHKGPGSPRGGRHRPSDLRGLPRRPRSRGAVGPDGREDDQGAAGDTEGRGRVGMARPEPRRRPPLAPPRSVGQRRRQARPYRRAARRALRGRLAESARRVDTPHGGGGGPAPGRGDRAPLAGPRSRGPAGERRARGLAGADAGSERRAPAEDRQGGRREGARGASRYPTGSSRRSAAGTSGPSWRAGRTPAATSGRASTAGRWAPTALARPWSACSGEPGLWTRRSGRW